MIQVFPHPAKLQPPLLLFSSKYPPTAIKLPIFPQTLAFPAVKKPKSAYSLVPVPGTLGPPHQMFHLKMCLLDLLAPGGNHNHKKPKSSKYTRYPHYNDINIIHFNENMSMMNKNDNIKFVPYKQRQNKAGHKSKQEWGVEAVSFNFSSDDRMTTSEESDVERIDFSDSAIQTSNNDSFCTLCSSSFSFSNCNGCGDNFCGSKCSSERIHLCDGRRGEDIQFVTKYRK